MNAIYSGRWFVLVLLLGLAADAWGAEGRLVRFDPPVSQWPLNRPFSVMLEIEGDAVDEVIVHARMPRHDHGLVERPAVSAGKERNRIAVEGLLLHMAGTWEIYFDLRTGALIERVQVDLTLP